MPVEPLFVADMPTLKARLRLAGVKSAASDLIDEAVEKVLGGFLRRLGSVKVNELKLIAYTENTTDSTLILRTIANTTEVLWVRCELLRLLPNFSMDGGGDALARWNDDAAFRRESEFQREAELKRCEEELARALDILDGDPALGKETRLRVKATAFEPTGLEADPSDCRWSLW